MRHAGASGTRGTSHVRVTQTPTGPPGHNWSSSAAWGSIPSKQRRHRARPNRCYAQIEGKRWLDTALAETVPRGEARLIGDADTSPSTCAVPTPSCRPSETY